MITRGVICILIVSPKGCLRKFFALQIYFHQLVFMSVALEASQAEFRANPGYLV